MQSIDLACNEGPCPSGTLLDVLDSIGTLRRYPDTAQVALKISARLGVTPQQVLVTAGGDDALDRCCRAWVRPGTEVVVPTPGFVMTERYAKLAGATIRAVPWWTGPLPISHLLAAITEETALVVLTSPNNPTGATITEMELRAIAARAPRLILDHAYVEFADCDLTAVAMELGAVVIRTLSKAWGLAGLRVGYALGSSEQIDQLDHYGAPYPCAGPSLALAAAALDQGPPDLSSIPPMRAALSQSLRRWGATPLPSQANFVLASCDRVEWTQSALESLGVSIRTFPSRVELTDHIRLSCPPDPAQLDWVDHALGSARCPQALLFDMDGVIADVSGSYRAAIVATARSFGVTIAAEDIVRLKRAGDANNDWILTQRLLSEQGVDVAIASVTDRFEAYYQRLRHCESLLVNPEWLRSLALPLAIVTGRPRRDAEWFLQRFQIRNRFVTLVCMDDAPAKPSPAPVRLAMSRLGVTRAWMFGDTIDDVRAAVAAGAVPIGVGTAPIAGAARTVRCVEEVDSWLV